MKVAGLPGFRPPHQLSKAIYYAVISLLPEMPKPYPQKQRVEDRQSVFPQVPPDSGVIVMHAVAHLRHPIMSDCYVCYPVCYSLPCLS